jgi:peptidoglycan hydrolase-like protein with peptidoglycan-binding domain
LILLAVAMAIAGPAAAVAVGAGPVSGGGGLGSPTGTTTSPATGTTTTPLTTPTGSTTTTSPPPVISPGPGGNPLRSRGMWIWVVGSSSGGSVPAIIAQARASGISTLMVKSGDGSSFWSQFNPTLVSELHAAHLHVCAWQFVYGINPGQEAQVGAQAVHDGADCLIIDAEGQYEGKYVQAQTYIKTLRGLVGYSYPLALAGFPYIDYHPSFPYSVFLGPGGAQYNTPQMYWRDIGTSVDAVYAHTYEYNELYRRPIDPLGQLYNNPPLGQVRRFRAVSRAYHAGNVSWWDWQSASAADFRAAAQPVASLAGFVPYTTVASLSLHALGDLVVWAQEHLVSAGDQVTIDGDFGSQTMTAVENLQLAHGLPVTGVIDPGTWTVLLRYRTARVKWVSGKNGLSASAARGGTEVLPLPKSAHLKAKRNELAGAGGAGRPAASRHR